MKDSTITKILLEREQKRNYYLREDLKYNPHKRNAFGNLDMTEVELYWNNRIVAALI